MGIFKRILPALSLSFAAALGVLGENAGAQTLEELHRRAAQEGVVNFYGTLAQVNAEKIR